MCDLDPLVHRYIYTHTESTSSPTRVPTRAPTLPTIVSQRMTLEVTESQGGKGTAQGSEMRWKTLYPLSVLCESTDVQGHSMVDTVTRGNGRGVLMARCRERGPPTAFRVLVLSAYSLRSRTTGSNPPADAADAVPKCQSYPSALQPPHVASKYCKSDI